MKAEDRTKSMLEAAVKLAKKSGLAAVTRRAVAEACKCSESLVNVYLGNIPNMHKKVKAHAKKSGVTLPEPPVKKAPVKKAPVKKAPVKKAARKPKAAPISVPQLPL